MIVCRNGSHQNPDGAIQCEACYTPLPSMVNCPSCGASVQSDASFCGQCGANLNVLLSPTASGTESTSSTGTDPASPDLSGHSGAQSDDLEGINIPDITVPDLVEFDPLMDPEPLTADIPDLNPLPEEQKPMESDVGQDIAQPSSTPPSILAADVETPANAPASLPNLSETAATQSSSVSSSPTTAPTFKSTQIQTQSVQLLHTHTETIVELPPHLTIVHIGKPNDRVPPDIDVSGFKDSEVVSRVHADIRVEGDSYYLEDTGSSNGTYVNNIPLAPGNRHKLRSGDRIALGKGDKVSFIIQMS